MCHNGTFSGYGQGMSRQGRLMSRVMLDGQRNPYPQMKRLK